MEHIRRAFLKGAATLAASVVTANAALAQEGSDMKLSHSSNSAETPAPIITGVSQAESLPREDVGGGEEDAHLIAGPSIVVAHPRGRRTPLDAGFAVHSDATGAHGIAEAIALGVPIAILLHLAIEGFQVVPTHVRGLGRGHVAFRPGRVRRFRVGGLGGQKRTHQCKINTARDWA
jgi:hypothetical protein